ncbi:piggyBac transposable element-derived protein 4-like [Orussus abietinus]|uniref:piggyBac transposable element-derived protein 4-like n=1 Tax=Orussus abietinus TaxID=222816 RepID=UPI000C7162FB|nr:piggyBac transposable element-derived protein 4-like [Orussus abietinus]
MYKKRSKIGKKARTSRESKSSERVEEIVINSNENSDDSSVIVPVVNRARRLIISDSDEEENPRPDLSVKWNWKETDNTIKIWEYSDSHGVKDYVLDQLETHDGLLDLFFIVFDDSFWDIVVTQTNLYAQQIMSNGRRKKVDDGWFPVTKDEMLAYYALCVLMTQVKKPNIQMHWSKREVIETPIFGKDRLAYKQFNPSKRARFGIKIYKLCEAKSGFCSKFKIYIGQDKINPNDSASENVVVELTKPVVNKGYTLYMDNWYSSPALFLRLHNQKTNVIGTVRNTRKNMPKDLAPKKLKPGEYLYRACNGLLAVRWKDKRDVYMLTTKHASVELIEVRDRHDRTKLKPNCVIEYNNGMGGIDLNDQICLTTQDAWYLQEVKHQQAQYWAHFAKHIDPTTAKQHPTRMCKIW